MVVPKNNNKTETNNNKTERFCSSNFLAERSGERDSDKGTDRGSDRQRFYGSNLHEKRDFTTETYIWAEKESKRLRWRGGGLVCAMHLHSLFEITGSNKCVFKYGANAMLNKWTQTRTFSAGHLPWSHFLYSILQHSNSAATKKPTLTLFTHTDSTARL